jgi:glycosyltransferase involved in cell wall biosynthesis
MTRRLRIGVDARELLGATTGVGRYLGELLKRWTVRPDATERSFILYTPEPLSIQLPPATTDTRVVGRRRGTWWEQTHLGRAVRADAPDVFFAPAYTAPLSLPMPLAVTIHDVSFAAHPEWFRPREGLRRRWLTRRTARHAAIVLTDSEFSRREIERRLQIDPAKIDVIPPGVNLPAVVDAGPRREPMVLFVGSIFNRRRVPDLIAAFAKAAAELPAARLVIVGDDRTWPAQDLAAIAAAYGVAPRVDFPRYLPDRALAELYAKASVFAFLSEYEGFGLTPLEALSAGVPVIVLDTPVAREVYGDAAVYVNRGDVESTAREIRRLLVDPTTGADHVGRGRARLARYSWDSAAERTLAHLERIARP